MRRGMTGGWLCVLWVLCACGPGINNNPPSTNPDGGTPTSEVSLAPLTLGNMVVDVESAELRIQVRGSGFVPTGTTAYLNDRPLPTTFVSSTELSIRIASSELNGEATLLLDVRVRVRHPQYTGGARSPGVSIALPAPELHSLTPDTLISSPAEPVRITVTGKHFVQGSRAVFRGTSHPLTVTSSQEGAVLLPPEALVATTSAEEELLHIEVPRPRAASTAPLPLKVTNPLPVITGVWPPTLSSVEAFHGNAGTAPLQHIIVSGTGVRSTTVVKWNGEALKTSTYDGRERLMAELPYDARLNNRTVQITLETPGPAGGGESANHPLRVKSEPVIHDLSPAWILPGTPDVWLSFTGEGLGRPGQLEVFWNGARLETVSGPNSSGVYTALVPPTRVAQPGLFAVTVKRTFDDAESAPLLVEVLAKAPAPVAFSLTPSVLSVGDAPGMLIVEGAGFTAQSVIAFDGRERATTFVDASHLTTQVDAGNLAVKRRYTVTVLTPFPGGGTSLPLLLVVHEERPVPVIAYINGNHQAPTVPAGHGAQHLLITGQGFGPNSVVRWDGQPMPSQWRCSNSATCTAGPGETSELEVEVPAEWLEQPATHQLTVFNAGPGGGETPPRHLVVTSVGAPTLSLPFNAVDVGAPQASDRKVVVSTLGVNGKPASRVMLDGNVRLPVGGSSPPIIQLTPEDVATARVFEVRTYTEGHGLSAPGYIYVQGPLPPSLRAVAPGVLSQNEWAPGEKRSLALGGEHVQWKYSWDRPFTTTVDWAGQSYPLTESYKPRGGWRWLEGSKLEWPGVHTLTLSRVADGGGVSLPALLHVVPERPVPLVTHVFPRSATAGAPALKLRVHGKGIHAASVLRWKDLRLSLKPSVPEWRSWDVLPLDFEAIVPGEALATPGMVAVTVETPGPGGGISPPVHVVVE